MNKFIHTTIKLSFLSVIISMAALLNTAPTAGATTQTAHNGQSVVDNRLILNPEIGIHITVDDVSKDYYVPMGTVSNALNYLNISLSEIDRVNYAYYPIYKSIPYKTVEQESDKLFVGQTKMLQKGKPGSTEYIYKDKYVNGEIISHKCIKQQVLTYPTDKIIVKGNRNIDIINKSYNNKTSYLVKTKYDNKDFKLPMVKLSDKDRDMLERIVTGEFGGSYVGSCLIAQSIKCAIVYDGYTSVSAVIKGMGYVGSTANRSQNAVNAVKYIFDDNNLAVRHRLFYMCTKDYYDSTPGNFHSTQNFILQYENVLFFDRW